MGAPISLSPTVSALWIPACHVSQRSCCLVDAAARDQDPAHKRPPSPEVSRIFGGVQPHTNGSQFQNHRPGRYNAATSVDPAASTESPPQQQQQQLFNTTGCEACTRRSPPRGSPSTAPAASVARKTRPGTAGTARGAITITRVRRDEVSRRVTKVQ